MNVYVIYFPHGKRYVGVETKPGKRIDDHRRMASLHTKDPKDHQVVDIAIRKHGWANCQWRYLATNCSREEGFALERFFIKAMRSRERGWGYNLTDGGEGSPGAVITEERKARRKKTMQSRGIHGAEYMCTPEARAKRLESYRKIPKTAWNKGRPMPAEERENLSAKLKGQTAWNKGVPMTEELRQNLIRSKTGKIGLPAGPNGERRFFRPEQLI